MQSDNLAKQLTLRQVIENGVQLFEASDLCFAQGMPEAVDEAVFIALSLLDLPLELEDFDTRLNDNQITIVTNAYKARVEDHVPAAYLAKRCWFAGLEFYVDERVLIPRSPFAELIENQFSPWVEAGRVKNILDLCTGGGCIAIACAHFFKDSHVMASDLSKDALDVAAINIKNHELQSRVGLIESNIFESIPDQKFDLIVSNPPYVSTSEYDELPDEFSHEPGMALVAGEDGMDIVIEILKNARSFLSDEGVLIVEVGYSQYALEKRLPGVPFFWFEFEFGGDGVFLLTASQLDDFDTVIMAA